MNYGTNMKCENCEEKHNGSYGSGRFCNEKCARGFSTKAKRQEINTRVSKILKNKTRPKRRKVLINKIKIIEYIVTLCPNCGGIKRNKHKFCSVTCNTLSKKKEKFKEIEQNNGIGCDIRQIKDYLVCKYGHYCWVCQLKYWMGLPIPLIIDHINGRSKDNRLENLQLVCGNCDMQLPTYKSKNKNSDRTTRVGKW